MFTIFAEDRQTKAMHFASNCFSLRAYQHDPTHQIARIRTSPTFEASMKRAIYLCPRANAILFRWQGDKWEQSFPCFRNNTSMNF
jgi:hypothetical protein